MIQTIRSDGPLVMLVSFAATLCLLLLAFRRFSYIGLTASALLLGILWMAGTMTVFKMRLNFLNFVAFPITFGNGVDYSVNVMRRYVQEIKQGVSGTSAIKTAVTSTGGAVALCSLTTIIGYMSLYTSANQALNSFGMAMTISEITCLFAATLTLPAVLLLPRYISKHTQKQ